MHLQLKFQRSLSTGRINRNRVGCKNKGQPLVSTSITTGRRCRRYSRWCRTGTADCGRQTNRAKWWGQRRRGRTGVRAGWGEAGWLRSASEANEEPKWKAKRITLLRNSASPNGAGRCMVRMRAPSGWLVAQLRLSAIPHIPFTIYHIPAGHWHSVY